MCLYLYFNSKYKHTDKTFYPKGDEIKVLRAKRYLGFVVPLLTSTYETEDPIFTKPGIDIRPVKETSKR
jgi:hypothetical protein